MSTSACPVWRYTHRVRRFQAIGTNVSFRCDVCGAQVPPLANGSYRNHCPRCLHSRHVDVFPGDRASACQGLLEPVAVHHSGKKGWTIVHRCRRCGEERRNRAALDDPAMPDDYTLLVRLASRAAPSDATHDRREFWRNTARRRRGRRARGGGR